MAADGATFLLLASLLVDRGPIDVPRAAGQPASRIANAPWALEVLAFDTGTPTSLWVGLINRSGEARLVCVLTRGIGYEERDGTLKGSTEGGSPHACDVEDQFQLLRAGQTLFVRQPLPARLADRISGPLRVELGVVGRPVTGDTSRREPVGVTWEGTLKQAADHGRALAPQAKRGK